MTPEVARLIRWIATNAETESAFLSPLPISSVNAHALLDEIVAAWGLKKEDVSILVAEANP